MAPSPVDHSMLRDRLRVCPPNTQSVFASVGNFHGRQERSVSLNRAWRACHALHRGLLPGCWAGSSLVDSQENSEKAVSSNLPLARPQWSALRLPVVMEDRLRQKKQGLGSCRVGTASSTAVFKGPPVTALDLVWGASSRAVRLSIEHCHHLFG